VVGQGGCGKTSLLNALMGKPVRDDEKSTDSAEPHVVEVFALEGEAWKAAEERRFAVAAAAAASRVSEVTGPDDDASGINSSLIAFPPSDVKEFEEELNKTGEGAQSSGGKSIVLDVWDMGGQKEYRFTHQMFLSDDAIYVVCVDSAEKKWEDELGYWLEAIRTRAPEAPVVVVLTKVDVGVLTKKQVDEFLLKRNDVLKFVVPTSSKKGHVAELRGLLFSLAESLLKEKNNEKPIIWLNFLKHLRKEPRGPVKWSRVEEIASSSNLRDDKLKIVLKFFHSLTKILYYEDLDNMMVPDPLWLVGVARCLVTQDKYWAMQLQKAEGDPSVEKYVEKARFGEFSLELLEWLWRYPLNGGPPMMFGGENKLVQLMEKHRVIARAGDSFQIFAHPRIAKVHPSAALLEMQKFVLKVDVLPTPGILFDLVLGVLPGVEKGDEVYAWKSMDAILVGERQGNGFQAGCNSKFMLSRMAEDVVRTVKV
jgi:GTPase SAR1 family protein